jgi:hypothetical protein
MAEQTFVQATELTEAVSAEIDAAFQYKPWDAAKVAAGEKVRQVLAEAVKTIVANVPRSADRTTAIRKLREARMDCNSAITFDGKY